VFNGLTGQVIRSFLAYGPTFTGGVRVAAGDVNGDGKADIITGAGPGGGPHVEAFSGANLQLLQSFLAYDAGFRGGVYVAAGDVNGDGKADIITGPGIGGGPHVEAFDGTNHSLVLSFLAYSPITNPQIGPWQSGARVASYDVNLDGIADIIVSPGRGQRPVVRTFNGATLALLSSDFNATDPTFLGGIFVAGR
jgi:hypothetical protein